MPTHDLGLEHKEGGGQIQRHMVPTHKSPKPADSPRCRHRLTRVTVTMLTARVDRAIHEIEEALRVKVVVY